MGRHALTPTKHTSDGHGHLDHSHNINNLNPKSNTSFGSTICLCRASIPKQLTHIKAHHAVCPHFFVCCRRCFRIFENRKQLKQHQLTHNHMNQGQHRNNDGQCVYLCGYNGCKAVFASQWRLNKHKKSHDFESPIQ